MSMTRSVEFYCGERNVEENGFFGKFKWYEFSVDIAYSTDKTFCDTANLLRAFMKLHNIKIGYCDISCDFGGGYTLIRRYKYVNKDGSFITKPIRYVM